MATQVGLSATGQLSYNGFDFVGAHHVNVETRFKYGDSAKNIIAHEHTITVQFIVSNSTGQSTDSNLENIRKRLGEAGKALFFKGRGFGNDLNINFSTGGQRDIEDGPSPEVLSWLPVGNNLAADVTWRVRVTLAAKCVGGKSREFGLASLVYGMDFSIDRHGLTTRKITGHWTIVGRRGKDTADHDDYRSLFVVPTLPNFTREQKYTLATNKRRLDFVITDTPIASNNPYYPGMTAISAKHKVSWNRQKTTTWYHSISAQIQPVLGLNASQAWAVFSMLATERILNAKNDNQMFLDSLEAEEDIFGLSHSFSMTYRILRTLDDLVTGLWTPVNTTSWTVWRASMDALGLFGQGAVTGTRGLHLLRDVAANDLEITLCKPAQPTVINNQHQPPIVSPRLDTSSVQPYRNTEPPLEKSWLKYQNDVIPLRECPISRHSPIQGIQSDSGGWETDKSIPPDDAANYGPIKEGSLPDKIQESGLPRYSIRMQGTAQRAGHKIPRPVISDFGGLAAREVRSSQKQRLIGDFFGIPVYQSAWFVDYIVEASPGTVEPLRNQKDNIA